eukprot:TRINITY_DN55930_c0_g1_i1.p2 TRINITY_DN55930_c0_g1~~TRINITY_DN55930_c0_g1_i1.p2  ORF type:complete len:313 (+),score=182.08 TRINITY_DN55930_c0_g1_i1:96-1034(+)
MVKKLIEREGISCNCRDDKRFATPLMRACAAMQAGVVEYLYERDADVELEDNVGWTCLTWACWSVGAGAGWDAEASPQIFRRLLLESGMDVNHTTATGMTPLLTVAKFFGRVRSKRGSSNKKGKQAAGGRRKKKRKDHDDPFGDIDMRKPEAVFHILLCTFPDKAAAEAYAQKENVFGQSALTVSKDSKVSKAILDAISKLPGESTMNDDDDDAKKNKNKMESLQKTNTKGGNEDDDSDSSGDDGDGKRLIDDKEGRRRARRARRMAGEETGFPYCFRQQGLAKPPKKVNPAFAWAKQTQSAKRNKSAFGCF